MYTVYTTYTTYTIYTIYTIEPRPLSMSLAGGDAQPRSRVVVGWVPRRPQAPRWGGVVEGTPVKSLHRPTRADDA